ncbi:myeloid leukemia factor [Citrus sinensis]|nr:uncharacterized protein LOC102631053 [Citrus sinensis]XP_024954463.2 uncharacterized protein LOC102631053 [Citrus sinensis]XP_052292382.1 uncharacterized protein LOC102631053 [Citrus sinensis]KAH9721491.1 myeloid leukemia factor [Citrus sinensis]
MQRGRGGRDPFSDFGDPFAGFGGFGGGRSLMSSFFGGRDPFDDPFFTRPFGGGMFESSFFGPPNGSPFANMHQNAFIENQPPQPKRSRGPIIEELNSDDEKEQAAEEKNDNSRKHGRSSNGPVVERPEDEAEERKNKHLQHRNDYSRYNVAQHQPQTHSYTFSSSTVSYGGANGAYYTSSKTRRTGSDGVTFEESKEADTSTRQASHRVSRGLHNKGHSVARNLNSDGKVDTMQTLHNLDEDELDGFEEAWNGNARKVLPGWTGSFIGHNEMGSVSGGQNHQAGRGGWALPSVEQSQNSGRVALDGSGSSQKHHAGRMKNASNVKERTTRRRLGE